MYHCDPFDKDFSEECNHQHNERCSQCEALNNVLVRIENMVHSAAFHSEEDKDEASYLSTTSVNAISSWKSQQLRSVHQNQARLDARNALDKHSALDVSDWAMKFIPQRYRESQQDWFRQRGYVLAYCCCFPLDRGHPSLTATTRISQSWLGHHQKVNRHSDQANRFQ